MKEKTERRTTEFICVTLTIMMDAAAGGEAHKSFIT